MATIFDKSAPGRRGAGLPARDTPANPADAVPENLRRATPTGLCELSELDVVRHFAALSKKNYGVDTGFYPLGSCTMKYNPKACERAAALDGFASLHPMTAQLPGGAGRAQGALAVLYDLERLLCRVTGMDAFTLQPMAGAHGEFVGMAIAAAYHRKRGDPRTEVLIPDEAHGTNPASAAAAGYAVRTVPTDPSTGLIDMEKLREAAGPSTAALMMTNPNTLGLFNPRVAEIANIVHASGALFYCDGANMNAVMGKFRPGDAGFDAMHVNLHKTFAAPHGGGGPGAGPVGVKAHLEPFLPAPRVVKTGAFSLNFDYPDSVGPAAPFYGNFGVCVKAYAYILMLGGRGLLEASEQAVLNANYVMRSLLGSYDAPHPKTCMHECVLSAARQSEAGVKAADVAKALIDRGFHPPTIYFPLIVKEALMIEPTETEGKESLDAFIAAMLEIARAARTDPQSLHAAPVTTPVGRLDETKAAKAMDVASLAGA